MKITKAFFEDIRTLIVSSRTTISRGVALVQVHTNFEIGRRIVKEEQRGKDRAAYGKEVIKALAERLTDEFGKGFSTSNLAYMRSFYLLYPYRTPIFQTPSGKLRTAQIDQTLTGRLPIFQTPSGKLKSSTKPSPLRPFTLSWSHYVFLLGIKNSDERSFYEIEAGQQSWTIRELKRHFDSGLYQRLALSRDKKGIRRLPQEGLTVGPCRWPGGVLGERPKTNAT